MTAETSPETTRAAPLKWDEPLPLGWRVQLPEFPAGALPPVIRDFVKALSASTQTPLGLTAPVALGMLSACVGGRVRVEVRPDWEEPTNLFIVPVADPASLKSAVVAECRVPLDQAEKFLREALAEDAIRTSTERQVKEKHAEGLKQAAAKTGSMLDIQKAQRAALAAEEVEVVTLPQLTVGDATPEALIGRLADNNGRIAAISAEAGIFDNLIGRYSSKPNLDPVLMAHAGDMIQVDRQSRGSQRVERPALTLVASIQPFALHDLVGRDAFAGRGLLARVLWSLPADMAGTRSWDAPAIPERVRKEYRARLHDLAVTVGQYKEAHTLKLSADATQVFRAYYEKVEQMLVTGGALGDGLAKLWGGKLRGSAARIAGCLHAAQGSEVLTQEISAATMTAAIQIAEYFRHHAIAAFAGADDKRTQDARVVMRTLIKTKLHNFKVRELQRAVPRAQQKAALITGVLNYLVELGYVQPSGEGVWDWNPKAESALRTADSADSADRTHVPAAPAPDEVVSTPADSADRFADIHIQPELLSAAVSKGADNLTPMPRRGDTEPVSTVSTVSTLVADCVDCGWSLDSQGHASNCGGPS